MRDAVARFAAGLDSADPFFAAVSCSTIPMVVSDPTLPDHPLVYINQAFERLTGFSADEVLGRNCRFMQGPLTDQADVARLREAIARQERIDIDLLNHRRDGTPFWNRLMVAPVFDADGTLRYFVATQLDVTIERHRVRQLQDDRDALTAEVARREIAIEEREARLALALKAGGLGTWMISLPDMKLDASPSCLVNCGRPPDGSLSMEEYRDSLHSEDADRAFAAMDDAIRNGVPFDMEYRILTPSGEQRWIHVQGALQRRPDGTPLALSGFTSNITERKFAEEHRAILARELTHRVKNTLATVGAVVSQTLRDASSLEEGRNAVAGRIATLGAAHELLVRDEVEGATIKEIVERVLAPFMDVGGHRFTIEGAAIRLSPDITLALSMALHELVTNAIKYGALSVAEGSVAIRWALSGTTNERRFTFSWIERNGPAVVPPTRTGFGTRMIERVLAGRTRGAAAMTYPPEGVRFEIEAAV
ncbi:PAS domain-containing protein [uncultured Sphingomonas sp.]|uniref:HWE histidine kinase domain-containing protein n=1 Tax=uncultured Sphingomonas sp. TaxID=158754 RepID=UPI0025F9FF81|nr:PAS domain-containing protein [uncultured Sphingomonas sp.]